MRVPVIQEGVHYDNGYFFAPGAIKWNEDVSLPVEDVASQALVGTATDIQRDEEGHISADVILNSGWTVDDGEEYSFYGNQIVGEKEGDISVIASIKLRSVSIVANKPKVVE